MLLLSKFNPSLSLKTKYDFTVYMLMVTIQDALETPDFFGRLEKKNNNK